MSYFPLMVQLEQAPVLLVGGGRTAFHKARILVDFGACVRVVAPEVLPELEQLPVQVERRPFSGADLEQSDWTLVVAATDCRTVNGQVSRLCRQRRIPVNVVDDPEFCSFYFPALLREGEVVCAVSSGGGNRRFTFLISGHQTIFVNRSNCGIIRRPSYIFIKRIIRINRRF